MPSYRRLFIPAGTYFFTATLEGRSQRLLTENIDALRHGFRYVRERHPFETVAIVVLPDHLHCVWISPPGGHDFPMRWRLLKSHFTRQPMDAGAGRRKRERAVWRRRFREHAIRDDADLENHVNYVYGNQEKHELVADADDWPHSSWHR